MIILVSLMIFSLVLGILIPHVNTSDNKKWYLIIMFSLSCLVSALRASSIGIDTDGYVVLFNQIKDFGLRDSFLYLSFEKGYVVLNYLIGAVLGNVQWLLAVVSLVISLAFALYIYRYSENVVVSTFLYIVLIFSATMNISRQYLAIAFIIFALKYVYDKKIIPTILLIIIASLFHYSALLFIPISILATPKIRIGKKHVIWGVILAILLIVFLNYALDVFFTLFPKYQHIMDTVYFSRIQVISLPLLTSYLLVAISSIILVYRDKSTVEAERESFYLNTLMFCAFICCYIASSYFWIAARLSPYFQISFLVVLPGSINKLSAKDPAIKYIIYMVLIALFGYFGWKSFAADAHGLLPYSFFWQ